MHPHHRRSIRIPGYDYSQPGYYFITLCAHDQCCCFGEIKDSLMIPNDLGNLILNCWSEIPSHYSETALDAFVLMPNHLHGIVILTGRGRACSAPKTKFEKPTNVSLAAVIGSFKSAVARSWHLSCKRPYEPIWQRNYFEYVIRNDHKLIQIRKYIECNPARWVKDKYHPDKK